MVKPLKGEVVVVPFPFSDLSASKRRSALVVSGLSSSDDVILCQITTPFRSDGYSIPLKSADFMSGGLDHDSFIRPNRLFTADSKIVVKSKGNVRQSKIDEVVKKIIDIVRT
jgi:mRNA interferase MazF